MTSAFRRRPSDRPSTDEAGTTTFLLRRAQEDTREWQLLGSIIIHPHRTLASSRVSNSPILALDQSLSGISRSHARTHPSIFMLLYSGQQQPSIRVESQDSGLCFPLYAPHPKALPAAFARWRVYSSAPKIASFCSISACTAIRCNCISLISRSMLNGRIIVGANTTARFNGVIRFSDSCAITRAKC